MIKRLIREGEVIPRFYGIAYRRDCHRYMVCYPLPLNLIIGWLDRIVLWAVTTQAERKSDFDAGVRQGYEMGRDNGLLEGWHDAERHFGTPTQISGTKIEKGDKDA